MLPATSVARENGEPEHGARWMPWDARQGLAKCGGRASLIALMQRSAPIAYHVFAQHSRP